MGLPGLTASSPLTLYLLPPHPSHTTRTFSSQHCVPITLEQYLAYSSRCLLNIGQINEKKTWKWQQKPSSTCMLLRSISFSQTDPFTHSFIHSAAMSVMYGLSSTVLTLETKLTFCDNQIFLGHLVLKNYFCNSVSACESTFSWYYVTN